MNTTMKRPTPEQVTRCRAAAWVTPAIRQLFLAELANEGPTDDHGVTPATLASTIDSLLQAPDILCPGWVEDDWVALLSIVRLVGLDAIVADLVD